MPKASTSPPGSSKPRDRAKLLGWERLFREYEEEFGAFTEEELAEADAWIDAGEQELQEMRKRRGR
jgi:hypothetical protein